MKQKRFRYLLLLLSALLLGGCSPTDSLPTVEEPKAFSPLLEATEDYGQEYLDRFVFFGESTTYHMKDREVLSGGRQTTCVWGPDNGTVNLDPTTPHLLVRYPETGEYLTPAEAAARRKPSYLVLCFGLNGAVQKIRRGQDSFKDCYQALIDSILSSSPDTRIILQSVPPIAENMDMSRYSIPVSELNSYLDTINSWTLSLAEELELRYLNTAEILKDDKGFLRQEYQVGDGHHLTREAYLAVLQYIRTHGYSQEV